MVLAQLYQQFLERNKLRDSKPRRAIFDYFFEHGHHVSTEMIHQALSKQGIRVGQATVYRTMRLLCQDKLARELSHDSGASYFEPVLNSCHHDHMICTKCDAHIEFYSQELENLQFALAIEQGFKITSHAHYLYGLCAQCQQASE